jgi:hypothetical protein
MFAWWSPTEGALANRAGAVEGQRNEVSLKPRDTKKISSIVRPCIVPQISLSFYTLQQLTLEYENQ